MTKDYKGFSLFTDIEDSALRSWNRAAVIFNLNKDGEVELLTGYYESLPDEGKIGAYLTLQMIKEKGYEEARKELVGGSC